MKQRATASPHCIPCHSAGHLGRSRGFVALRRRVPPPPGKGLERSDCKLIDVLGVFGGARERPLPEARYRIEAKKRGQLAIELGVTVGQGPRVLEGLLDHYREALRGVAGAIGVDAASAVMLDIVAKRGVFGA